MTHDDSRGLTERLERSCGRPAGGWIVSSGPAGGIERLRAWFAGAPYAKHRHDTYAIGVTQSGVQVFDYRGAKRVSRPGDVAVLHPDEAHDGRAGTKDGFGYRIVYVEPALVAAALRDIHGRPIPLPFVREPVSSNARLARAVWRAFPSNLESLVVDAIVVELAEGLLAAEGGGQPMAPRRIDGAAIERARQLLDAEWSRVVHSAELEAITGLTRYDVARQFRHMFGTSPHRYLVGRRLERARERMHDGRSLAEVAQETGFADQAHFTRTFKRAFGLTPARYRALRTRGATV